MSAYLDPAQVGIEWLLDPQGVELPGLAREAETRTPESPCDADALARDADELRRLVRERHFGVATGLVGCPDDVVDAWSRRLARRPRTWSEAVTELQFDLRDALRDEHVRVFGAPRWRDGGAEQDEPGPAVESRVVDGALVLQVRRLVGDRNDEALLAQWSADADRHFAFDRIILDLRGNTGGNDGHTLAWAERRFRYVPRHVRDSVWAVRGTPLSLWNYAAWREARDGTDAVPPRLIAERHAPRPADEIALVHTDWPLEAGDRPWDGTMLVLVDRRTRSSGESSAWFLRDGLGARLVGTPTTGMIEYGNVAPYVLPGSGFAIYLPTKHNDYGMRVESVGFPVDAPLEDGVPADDVAARFDTFV
jgi:hypothetical protein